MKKILSQITICFICLCMINMALDNKVYAMDKTLGDNENQVHVVIPVESVSLNKSELKIVEGLQESLILTIHPIDATETSATWISSNEKIATVDEDGNVKAISPGTAVITVIVDEKLASCSITVLSSNDGWVHENNTWYYYENGQKTVGWKIIENKKYLFDAEGKVVEGGRYFIIDISKWQGDVNWTKVVLEDIDGVILRVSYGETIDSKFTEYIKQLNELAIPYGVYHYSTAKDVIQAKIQAENVIKMLKENNASPTLPLFVDIEEGGGHYDLNEIAKVYCKTFSLSDFLPGIYANQNYWKNYLTDPFLNMYYKWIADYGLNSNNENATASPTFETYDDIKNYSLWQYTNNGKINGIYGNVDFNVMYEWYIRRNEWKEINKEFVYYKSDGLLAKQWCQINDVWYYMNDEGIMQTNWQLINGQWYYFGQDGSMKTTWQFIDGIWYYFGTDGVMRTGWQKINGSWYCFSGNGAMKTDWQKINGYWYFFGSTGVMQTGWKSIDGSWYFFDENGVMKTDWQKVNGYWYFFNRTGVMQTGWQSINNSWYFFNENGVMQTDWKFINGYWYYFNMNGIMQTDWKLINGSWYYFGTNGIMRTGIQKINGTTYRFTSSGVWIK